MKKGSQKDSWMISLIIGWLVFVVSLTTWWLIFSLRIISQLSTFVGGTESSHQQKMLVMEGGTLIIFLLVGGVALVYFALRERQRFQEVSHFFSTFSHDLKTSISRLVLQGERLFDKELLAGKDRASDEAKKFQKNLLALEMQLENSLHLAQQGTRGLTLQSMDLKPIISRIHGNWPELKVSLQGQSQKKFKADAVALESILKNLVSNSVLHGEAEEIYFKVSDKNNQIEIHYSDNGKEFKGDAAQLGSRPQPSQKGTGIGLFIVQQWADRMKAELKFSQTERGSLQAHLTLPAGGEK